MSEIFTPVHPASAFEWDAENQQRRPIGAGIKRDTEPETTTRTCAAVIAGDVRPESHLVLNVARKAVKPSTFGMTANHVADVRANPTAYHPALVAAVTRPRTTVAVAPVAEPAVNLNELSPEALKAREAAKRAAERAERKRFVERREARQYVVTAADIELVKPHLLAGRKAGTIERAIKMPRLITAKIIRACAAELVAA